MRPWHLFSYQVMVKPSGPICNLDCAYCYYLPKAALYPGSSCVMPDEVLEAFTRQYIQSRRAQKVTFAWQGGEPTLLGLVFLAGVLPSSKKHPPDMHVENTLQTNGTLLDEGRCYFFKENHFLIGVSIDGPPELHDVYCKYEAGAGSAARTLRGLACLKEHGVGFNSLRTAHAGTVEHPMTKYEYFRDELGAQFIQFIPIVQRDNKSGHQTRNRVTDRSVTGIGCGEFLIRIFDDWVRRDVGSVFVQLFDVALAKWAGAPGNLCIFEQICGLALALAHNGDLFSCDHYVEPKLKLGNISKNPLGKLVSSHKQTQFGMNKRGTLPQQCLDCEVLFSCNERCPKNRIRNTLDGEVELN